MGRVTDLREHMAKIVLGAATVPAPSEDGRAQIVYAEGQLPEVVDQAEQALLRVPGLPRLYQRGGMLIRIVRRAPTSARRIHRAPGSLALIPVDAPALVELLTEAADWLRTDKRSGGYRVMNCPHEVANVLLARGQWRFHALTGLVEAPTLRPDGTVLEAIGYDPETGLFLDTGSTLFDPVNLKPTRQEAMNALEQVLEILTEFAFDGETDRAVALAALLTGLVRQSLTAAPLFGFSATVMGSGKTYLAHAVSLLACGRMAPVIAPPKDAKEEDKTLFSAMLEGDAILVYDNVEFQLSSDLLCAVLTSETLRGRVLGSSRTASVSTACTFLVTGNNLVIAGDLSARALVCRLDPRCAHPEHRKFTRDLTAWIPAQRARLVPAALTFLCGYLQAKDKPTIEPWQRFPDWDRLIRAAIVWAGIPDPLDALRHGEASDPRRLEHQTVMECWREQFGAKPMTARDVVKAASDRALMQEYALRDALVDVAGERGEVNMRRLGRWLAKVAGRIQGVLKIERGNLRDGMQRWAVVQANQQPNEEQDPAQVGKCV